MAEEMMEQRPQEGQGEPEEKMDPALEREVQAFTGGILKMLHGRETKGHVYKMLQSAPPEKSIPEAVYHINSRLAGKLTQKGSKPTPEALFAGTMLATKELVDIGNAGGFFEQEISENPEDLMPLFKESLQRMIVEGVKSKLLDPIEVQQKIEPLLSDEQRQMGLSAAQKTGIPAEAGQGQAMEMYAQQAVDKDRQIQSTKMAAQNNQGMLQQARMQGGL